MPRLKTYDIFISHAWSYHQDYYRVQDFLNSAKRFKWRNYSVPQHDPLHLHTKKSLREQLKKQISPVNIVLILAGMYVPHRDWIQFEINVAQSLGKPMIGIRLRGQQRIPSAVRVAVDDLVGWQSKSIVKAIRNHSL